MLREGFGPRLLRRYIHFAANTGYPPFFGEYINASGRLELFRPGYGFGEQGGQGAARDLDGPDHAMLIVERSDMEGGL